MSLQQDNSAVEGLKKKKTCRSRLTGGRGIMSGVKIMQTQNIIKTKRIRERLRERQPGCQQVGWMGALSGGAAGGSALLLCFVPPQLGWIWSSFCCDRLWAASDSSRLMIHYAQCKQTASQ